MKICTPLFKVAVFLLFSMTAFAQDKSPVKFGKISAEDFDLSKYNFDTSVSAVVISDVGSSGFEGNTKGWFTLVYKHQKRIKILNKNGFNAATIEIGLYSDGSAEEKLASLKAFTYNNENGKITNTELANDALFKDKISKNRVVRKFTFPAVKVGSIIEYSYTINSDFLFNLQPWAFQGEYPRIWSEYNVKLPVFFDYVTLSQGYQAYDINTSKKTFETFAVTIPGGSLADDHVTLSGDVGNFRWVMKNVPVLKEEAFTSTVDNHISKIEFQLSQIRLPNQPVEDIMGDWKKVSEKMMAREDFGLQINRNNNWLDVDMKSITAGATIPLEKVKRIYAFVRDNFTCTDYSEKYTGNSLKTIFKNKNGNVAEINLLLVAMLRHENFEADPVILSTRENGFVHEFYPLINRFNYVIAQVKVDEVPIYLDASHAELGFDKLSSESYNGFARVIGKTPTLLNFDANTLKEAKTSTVFIINSDSGEQQGSFQSTLGYYESIAYRKKIKEKGEAEFFKKMKSAYNFDIGMTNQGIDSLKILEQPLAIHFDFKVNNAQEDMIYFNPMMGEGYKENFLKAAERKYPVEMPYAMDETFILSMEIPKNYTVEEIPKSAKVSFNEGEGYFEYMISKSETLIQLRSRVTLKKAVFMPDDYNSLRDFFAYVIKKHSEQIVFKKKK